MDERTSPENASMSVLKLQIKFDGPELQAHEMDVTLLGPALLAFGELCQESNKVLNGNRASIKVLLGADVQGGSITIDLHIVQHIWEQVRTFINKDSVADAKTLCEWLGIVTGGNDWNDVSVQIFADQKR